MSDPYDLRRPPRSQVQPPKPPPPPRDDLKVEMRMRCMEAAVKILTSKVQIDGTRQVTIDTMCNMADNMLVYVLTGKAP